MHKQPRGFTLVELVVVIMILGILAGVAAPKLLGTSSTATENGLKQTLSVVRDAIELYAAQNAGALPPATDDATFKASLANFLRGDFPKCPVGKKDSTVTIIATAAVADNATGWMYSTLDGTFICNATGNDSKSVAYSTY
ncbi:Type II secretion system protein G precursor [Botrimarina colliarenosi]|uniref:Type II secretion system protein G n=1 Tax=Botrimarina colliarenosi TaxID=2528001 RepID=A0A5C6AG92_9BACT|nr:type II secretion system protein [Botrimarina colliarenosi]TWT98081.1 Type II secretion system protein G precursor [Botrimarina colliarenosi]